MKSVALKRSDRLQTQILVITWVTVCTLFCLIPLFITTLNAFKSNLEIETSIFAFPAADGLGLNIKTNFIIKAPPKDSLIFYTIHFKLNIYIYRE